MKTLQWIKLTKLNKTKMKSEKSEVNPSLKKGWTDFMSETVTFSEHFCYFLKQLPSAL